MKYMTFKFIRYGLGLDLHNMGDSIQIVGYARFANSDNLDLWNFFIKSCIAILSTQYKLRLQIAKGSLMSEHDLNTEYGEISSFWWRKGECVHRQDEVYDKEDPKALAYLLTRLLSTDTMAIIKALAEQEEENL